MPEGDITQQDSQAMDTSTPGVSVETYNASKNEAEDLRQQLAVLKAKTDMYDGQKREALQGMKAEVETFIKDEILGDKAFEPYKQELASMARWAPDMDKGEALDTNLSIGRLVACCSQKFKREREEFSKTSDSANLLASANKELDEVKGDRDTKLQRITELEGLVEERTKAAQAFQDELAKHGAIQTKIDFSLKSARENTTGGASSSVAGVTKTVEEASLNSAPIDPNAALFDFMASGPQNGGLKIGQSGTGHHFLGAAGGNAGTDGIAQAVRGY